MVAVANHPKAEMHIVKAVAGSFGLKVDDVFVPMLKGKSYLLGSRERLSRVDALVSKADLSSKMGLGRLFITLSGAFIGIEGLVTLTGAATIAAPIAEVLGLSATPLVLTGIAIGLILLGSYMLVKGIGLTWPLIRAELDEAFGAEAMATIFG